MLTRWFAIVAAAAALQGCYKYVPIESPAAAPPGAEVRAELNDSGVVALAPQVGPSVYLIDGRLVERSDDQLVLAVNAVTSRRNELEQLWNGERVTVPRFAIGTLRERRISPQRTAVTAGGILAAVVALYFAFDVAGSAGGTGKNGGGNQQ